MFFNPLAETENDLSHYKKNYSADILISTCGICFKLFVMIHDNLWYSIIYSEGFFFKIFISFIDNYYFVTV